MLIDCVATVSYKKYGFNTHLLIPSSLIHTAIRQVFCLIKPDPKIKSDKKKLRKYFFLTKKTIMHVSKPVIEISKFLSSILIQQ